MDECSGGNRRKACPLPLSSPSTWQCNTLTRSFQFSQWGQRALAEDLPFATTLQLVSYSSTKTLLRCEEVRGISTPLTIFQGPISQFGISRPWAPFTSLSAACLLVIYYASLRGGELRSVHLVHP